MTGSLDELKIFNEALTESQVKEIYDGKEISGDKTLLQELVDSVAKYVETDYTTGIMGSVCSGFNCSKCFIRKGSGFS